MCNLGSGVYQQRLQHATHVTCADCSLQGIFSSHHLCQANARCHFDDLLIDV